MSIDSKKIFLPAFSRREAKPEEWKSRRTPPNRVGATEKPKDNSKPFQISVEPALRQKLDQLFDLKNFSQKSEEGKVTELPAGYAIVVQLYKDIDFMNHVRFQSPEVVDTYLQKNHPTALSYLKAHQLRVITQVVGKGKEDEKSLAFRDPPEPDPGPDPDTACAFSNSSAVAAVRSDAVAAARASVKGVASAIAAAAADAKAAACVNTFGNDKRRS